MNDKVAPQTEDELEGFETFEENFDAAQDDASVDDSISDADFQDIPDEVDADVFGDDQSPPPLKKKTNWFNIGVATIAIAVAGTLIWMKLGPQLMGSGDMGVVAPMASGLNGNDLAASSPRDSENAAQQAVQPNLSGTSQSGLLDNPDQFANLAQNAETKAKETPSAIADPFAGLNDQPAAPIAPQPDVQTPSVPMPTPISAEPMATLPAPNQPEVAAAVNAIPAAPAQPVLTAVTTTTTSESAATGEVTQKISTMEQRLDALDEKLTSALDRLSAPAPADDSRLNAIQTALERLESRLDDMALNRTAVQAVRAESEAAPRPKKASAPKKVAKPKTESSQWDQPYTPPATQAAVTTGLSGWELRGAQPGRAIIAKGSDMREVGVGENIPGLGEITGIANVNGRWVVQGTQGRIAQ